MLCQATPVPECAWNPFSLLKVVVTILCSSKLIVQFWVTVQLQVSLSSLCAPGRVEPHITANAAAAFCVGGVLGIFTDHKHYRAHPSQELGPAAAHPASKERRKGHVFPSTFQFKDTAQKFMCDACPGFQLMHAHVHHVCQPPVSLTLFQLPFRGRGQSLVTH